MRQLIGSALIQIMACPYSAPIHYLKQSWFIVNLTPGNKFQWKLNRNSCIFIQENAFECRLSKWRSFCPGGDELRVRMDLRRCPLLLFSRGHVRLRAPYGLTCTQVLVKQIAGIHRGPLRRPRGHIWGPFHYIWINFDPNMDKKSLTHIVQGELLIHSQTSTAAPLKFRNG